MVNHSLTDIENLVLSPSIKDGIISLSISQLREMVTQHVQYVEKVQSLSKENEVLRKTLPRVPPAQSIPSVTYRTVPHTPGPELRPPTIINRRHSFCAGQAIPGLMWSEQIQSSMSGLTTRIEQQTLQTQWTNYIPADERHYSSNEIPQIPPDRQVYSKYSPQHQQYHYPMDQQPQNMLYPSQRESPGGEVYQYPPTSMAASYRYTQPLDGNSPTLPSDSLFLSPGKGLDPYSIPL